MDTIKRGIHEVCVDKTSCRHETSLDKTDEHKSKTGTVLQPTGHLTKDFIRKSYEDSQKDKK